MSISEYDIVRVVAVIPSGRVDRSVSSDRTPQVGDLGAVVFVLADTTGSEPIFVVESVGSDGHTLWLADILGSELERVSSGTGGA